MDFFRFSLKFGYFIHSTLLLGFHIPKIFHFFKHYCLAQLLKYLGLNILPLLIVLLLVFKVQHNTKNFSSAGSQQVQYQFFHIQCLIVIHIQFKAFVQKWHKKSLVSSCTRMDRFFNGSFCTHGVWFTRCQDLVTEIQISDMLYVLRVDH